ncbi:metal-binding protein [Rhizobium sp. Root73]|uniref:CHAD domain-containing protein n=1 Tax=unclassified Rhizobium TaxID=2613769 RepID=UPI000714F091|nr:MULTISPECIES: CHAD domain-containing protein [unclassified Rhizobium]KQV38961.1 metal-binding protein [Rhizobium sp. Root1204]KQY15991.1 metal-binding protein [Rhizobium sp. Root1334]KRC10167.1 metal-binding protein [Rhizobium sp. Root73]
MSYHIRPSEHFTDEFKAVGSEQLTLAIAVLTDRPQGLPEAIHDARKNFKRLRSLYRLAAADIPAFQRSENARIRKMSQMLSISRDATALVEVNRYLLEHAETNDERAALKRIGKVLITRRDERAAEGDQQEESVALALSTCGRALDSLACITFRDGGKKGAKRIAKGWRKALERASTALEACTDTTDAHLFHELRKRSQDYRFYLDLLQRLWPSAMHAKRVEVTKVVDLLGHHNDLALLASLVDEQPHLLGKSEDVAYLLSAVITRQKALREQALTVAASVFRDDPKDESRKIMLLWQDAV